MPFTVQVGQLYNPNVRHWPDNRVEYNYRVDHELIMFYRHPRRKEILAITQQPFNLSAVVLPPALFFCYKFDTDAAWSDCPYTIHMVPEADRRIPPDLRPEDTALLGIVLVNSADGLVQGIRLVSFPPALASTLHSAIQQQAAAPFNQAAYDHHLAQVYKRYPTTEALIQGTNSPAYTLVKAPG